MSCRAVLVIVLSGATLASAYAADQSVPGGSAYYPNAYYPTSIDWTGWYTGLQVGGGFGHVSWTDPLSNASDSLTPSTALGGGQFGVNWTRDSLLLGAEADFTWMGFKSSTTDGAGFTHRFASNWLSLVTGRVGYASGPYLFYAKGGAAFANERNKVVTPAGLLADSGSTTQYGWTVGGGVEYAITRNWSARIEYDFVDLPSQNIVLVGPKLGQSPATVNYDIQKVAGAVNYHF